jgi:hypothetical protein
MKKRSKFMDGASIIVELNTRGASFMGKTTSKRVRSDRLTRFINQIELCYRNFQSQRFFDTLFACVNYLIRLSIKSLIYLPDKTNIYQSVSKIRI